MNWFALTHHSCLILQGKYVIWGEARYKNQVDGKTAEAAGDSKSAEKSQDGSGEVKQNEPNQTGSEVAAT